MSSIKSKLKHFRKIDLEIPDYKYLFSIIMKNKINITQMINAGVHFGHKTRYWNPKMNPYIYCTKTRD